MLQNPRYYFVGNKPGDLKKVAVPADAKRKPKETMTAFLARAGEVISIEPAENS